MPEERNVKYFGPAFAKRVTRATKRNRQETGNTYHHPTESRIVRKCIDLSCLKPLHAEGNKPKHPSEERWLEAYLIQRAKKNDWMLEMADKKWRFVSSQFKFREGEGKPARPLDLLLYEPKTQQLVVLELKAKRGKKELNTAKKELADYVDRLNGGLKDEIAKAFGPRVFGQERVSGVQGYIVWPRNGAADNAKYDFRPFGLIEYPRLEKPWDQYRRLGEDLVIEFTCVE